ncbi:MAG: hypothetical protein EG823_08640 [Actinobacteria bacterium]|nr:hypothetical protein [Actinomycetota bacterium]
MVAIVFLGCGVAAALSMCGSGGGSSSADEAAIRALIVQYNETLISGYRTMDMNPMQEVATLEQAEDEYIYMSSLAEGGVRLDATLVDLAFVRFSIETMSAQVETRETWDYRHYGREDGKLLLMQEGLIYDLAYDLEKQADGRWLVSDVRAISATSTVEPTRIATPTPIPSENP